MTWRLVHLAALAMLVTSACGTAAPPAPANGATAAPGVAAAATPKVVPTPRVLPSPVPRSQVAPNNRAVPGAMGVEVSLWGHPETTDRDLKLVKDAGFTWVKQRFEWRYLEPKKRGRYEWDEADRIVDAVTRAGLGLVARVDNQPEWSRGDGIFPDAGPPGDLEDWKDFLQDFANRYENHIHAIELWNEPNLSREWGGNKPDAKAYTELLKVGYAAVKGEAPGMLVISGGLSPTTENSAKAVSDVQFLTDMYAAGGKGSFDFLGAHAPGFKAPPDMDPDLVAKDPALTNNDPSPALAKRVYSFRHLEDLRKVMAANADTAHQIWVLEMGWTSDVRPGSPYQWHAVTEQQKADYLVGAFKYARANWADWIGLMTVIYIPDTAWTQKDEQWYWSITNPDGTPRPADDALKKFGTGG
jgi:hypothetical protein